jgi:hypothetical protein
MLPRDGHCRVSTQRAAHSRRLSSAKAFGLASIAALVTLGITAPSRTPRALSCPGRVWTSPETITLPRGATRRVARDPSITDDNGQIVIAGSNVQFFDEPRPPRSIFLWKSDRGELPAPSGNFEFQLPRVIAADGRIHLFWAESDSSPSAAGLAAQERVLNRLWWSVRDASGDWSSPIQLVDSRFLRWRATASALVRSFDGHGIDAVISATPRDRGTPFLMYLRYQDGMWLQTQIAGTEGAVYSTLAVDSSGIRYVGFIAAARDSGPDANSVFFTASRDGGRTWDKPALVSRSRDRMATQVFVVLTDSALHLVWGQNTTTGAHADVVRHAISTTAGRAWSLVGDFAPKGGVEALWAVGDACGSIHIVFEKSESGAFGGGLGYARWYHAWSDTASLFPGLMTLDPTVYANRNGSLVMAFLARSQNAGPRDSLSAMWSTLPIRPK